LTYGSLGFALDEGPKKLNAFVRYPDWDPSGKRILDRKHLVDEIETVIVLRVPPSVAIVV